jgi:hypothetical protein
MFNCFRQRSYERLAASLVFRAGRSIGKSIVLRSYNERYRDRLGRHRSFLNYVHLDNAPPELFMVMVDWTETSNSSNHGSSQTRSVSGPGLHRLHSWLVAVIYLSIPDVAGVRNGSSKNRLFCLDAMMQNFDFCIRHGRL